MFSFEGELQCNAVVNRFVFLNSWQEIGIFTLNHCHNYYVSTFQMPAWIFYLVGINKQLKVSSQLYETWVKRKTNYLNIYQQISMSKFNLFVTLIVTLTYYIYIPKVLLVLRWSTVTVGLQQRPCTRVPARTFCSAPLRRLVIVSRTYSRSFTSDTSDVIPGQIKQSLLNTGAVYHMFCFITTCSQLTYMIH